ncbi:MAG TPA: hypothetical protein VGB53_05785 [Rubricoccaceae bacterium]|jgi:hypothetical protein
MPHTSTPRRLRRLRSGSDALACALDSLASYIVPPSVARWARLGTDALALDAPRLVFHAPGTAPDTGGLDPIGDPDTRPVPAGGLTATLAFDSPDGPVHFPIALAVALEGEEAVRAALAWYVIEYLDEASDRIATAEALTRFLTDPIPAHAPAGY